MEFVLTFVSWLDWGYGFGGGGSQRQRVPFSSTMSIIHNLCLVMLTLISGWSRCLILPCNITLPAFPSDSLWKKVTTWAPHLRNEELYSHLFKMEYLRNLFEILLHRRFVFSPHLLIYSVIYFCQNGLAAFIFYYGL